MTPLPAVAIPAALSAVSFSPGLTSALFSAAGLLAAACLGGWLGDVAGCCWSKRALLANGLGAGEEGGLVYAR